MAIYRGTGGASDSTDDSTISAVTTQAGIATTKASEAASSATDANTSATNAAASATAASGHASTSSDNATASSGSATDAAGFATAASNSATAASNSATAAANSASTANSAEVQAVAAKTTEITGVYNDIANVNTVAGNITDVNTVATNSSNITAVAADASDIGTVAGSISNVNTVGDNIANVNTVASNNTNINTVAADASDIGTVAGISGNVTTVAGISSDVTTVAGLESKMDTVIADASDIGTVAGNIGDVSTVAGISSDVDTVAGISSDVTSVADNMTAVQNATTSATNAATSATSASDSASAAATSAGTASSSASDASTSETNAANSATSASNSATAASGSANAASGSESASSSSASAASGSASAAATSESNASSSETNAASSATAAAGSATAASGSASAAAASETNAAASESNANDSKNAAATSATNAATSETNAAASYDSFDDRYLGVKSSAPSTDNDGGALLTGALYFNSTNNTMNVFTGSAWAPVANNNIINPNVALTQDLATNGNDVKFGDNDKATFGASDDLQIYHDGSNSYVKDTGTGYLILGNSDAGTIIKNGSGQNLLTTTASAIRLTHSGSPKLATTATGIDVTGTATMDGLTVEAASDALIRISDSTNANQRLDLKHNGGVASLIAGNNGAYGAIKLQAYNGTDTVDRLRIATDGDISFYEDTGTTPKLFWDASAENLSLTGTSYAQPLLSVDNGSTGGHGAYIDTSGFTNAHYALSVNRNNGKQALRVDGLGDVSFYEDTGTTPKLVWDASAEKLTIDGSDNASSLATAVTGSVLELNGNSGGSAAAWFGSVSGGGQYVQSSNSAGTTSYDFLINPFGGDVGIGTSSPSEALEVAGNIQLSAGADRGIIGPDFRSLNIFANPNSSTEGIKFSTDGGTTTEVFIQDGGNVGIGTSSVVDKLQVQDSSSGSSPVLFSLVNNTGGSANATGVKLWMSGRAASTTNRGAYLEAVTTNTNNAHDLLFATSSSGSTPAERMRIDSSGNVGIGTSSPTAKLDVNGEGCFKKTYSYAQDNYHIKLKSAYGSGISSYISNIASGDRMNISAGGYYYGASLYQLADGATGMGAINIGEDGALTYQSTTGETANSLVNPTERMRIDSSGNVGIGTDSPASTLEIAKNDQTNGATLSITNSFDGSGWNAGDTIGTVDFRIDDGSSAEKVRGQIKVFDDSASGSTYPFANAMSFSTGYFNTLNERMRIDALGNASFNTTSISPSNNNVNGTAILQYGGASMSRTNSTTLDLNRSTSDGAILQFRKDGTSVGSIGTNSGYVRIGTDDTNLLMHSVIDTIVPHSGSANRDAAINLGYSGARFKDLHLSGTGYFGTSVGIGTSAPSSALHAKGGSISTPASASAFLANATARLVVNHGNEYGAYVGYLNSSNDAIGIQSARSSATAGPLSLNPYGGNVGIGTSSPASGLHLVNAGLSNQLRISNTTADSTTKYGGVLGSHYSNSEEPITGMLLTSTSSVTGGAVSIGGGISDANAVNNIKFYTAANNTTIVGTERMRIDSSGNLLVGTTSNPVSSSSVEGLYYEANNYLAVATAGVTSYFNRQGTDGIITQFRKNGAGVGNIGVALSDNLYFSGVDAGLGCGTGAIYPASTTGQASDNDTDLGTSATRFKDLHLSGGVYLGGTGAANKLDDYEEGTWTPTIIGSAGGTASTTIVNNSYTKIGNTVRAECYIREADLTGLSGSVWMSGLPFTVSGYCPTVISYCNLFSFDESTTSVSGFTESGATYIRLMKGSSNSSIGASEAIATSGTIMFTVTYKTNS